MQKFFISMASPTVFLSRVLAIPQEQETKCLQQALQEHKSLYKPDVGLPADIAQGVFKTEVIRRKIESLSSAQRALNEQKAALQVALASPDRPIEPRKKLKESIATSWLSWTVDVLDEAPIDILTCITRFVSAIFCFLFEAYQQEVYLQRSLRKLSLQAVAVDKFSEQSLQKSLLSREKQLDPEKVSRYHDYIHSIAVYRRTIASLRKAVLLAQKTFNFHYAILLSIVQNNHSRVRQLQILMRILGISEKYFVRETDPEYVFRDFDRWPFDAIWYFGIKKWLNEKIFTEQYGSFPWISCTKNGLLCIVLKNPDYTCRQPEKIQYFVLYEEKNREAFPIQFSWKLLTIQGDAKPHTITIEVSSEENAKPRTIVTSSVGFKKHNITSPEGRYILDTSSSTHTQLRAAVQAANLVIFE